MIFAEVEASVGCAAVNRRLRSTMQGWLVATCATALQVPASDGGVLGTSKEATLTMQLGRLCRDYGRYPEAEGYAKRAVSLLEKEVDATSLDAPESVVACSDAAAAKIRSLWLARDALSGIWRRMGAHLDESVTLQARVRGHFWPQASVSSWIAGGNLGRNMLAAGKPAAAAVVCEETLHTAENAEHPMTPETSMHLGHVLDGLALARLAVGDTAGALPLALRAVRCARVLAPGGNTLAVAYKLNTLGLILAAREASGGGAEPGTSAPTHQSASMTTTSPATKPPLVAWAVFSEAAAIAREQCGLDHAFTLCTSWNEASAIRDEQADGSAHERTDSAAPRGTAMNAWAVGDAAYRALFPDDEAGMTPRASRVCKLDPDHPLTQAALDARPG
jgi:hypothetical protein